MPVQTRFIPTTISRHNSVESLSTNGDRFSAGKISIELVIDARGLVKSARIKSTTMTSKPLEECVLAAMKTLKFPAPLGGGEIVVTYPFAFSNP